MGGANYELSQQSTFFKWPQSFSVEILLRPYQLDFMFLRQVKWLDNSEAGSLTTRPYNGYWTTSLQVSPWRMTLCLKVHSFLLWCPEAIYACVPSITLPYTQRCREYCHGTQITGMCLKQLHTIYYLEYSGASHGISLGWVELALYTHPILITCSCPFTIWKVEILGMINAGRLLFKSRGCVYVCVTYDSGGYADTALRMSTNG